MEEKNQESNEKEKEKEIIDLILGLSKTLTELNKNENPPKEEHHNHYDDIFLYILRNSIKAQLYIDLQTSRPSGFEISFTLKDYYVGLVYNNGKCRMRISTSSMTEETETKSEFCQSMFDIVRRHRKLTVSDFFV